MTERPSVCSTLRVAPPPQERCRRGRGLKEEGGQSTGGGIMLMDSRYNENDNNDDGDDDGDGDGD